MEEQEFDSLSETEQMRTLLQNGKVQVTFTKKDGSTRVLNGTTRMDFIPEYSHPSNGSMTRTDDLITVYDLDNEGWRSFHMDNVQDVKAI